MEACFLTSNTFPKTNSSPTRLLPPIKSRSNHLRLQSSSICCQLGHSSSSGDDTSRASGDWRSFRARLVATERVSRPESSAADAEDQDVATVERQGPIISIGEKWAHPLHEPERGCLLIATEKLDGVHIFERTVIILLSTGPIGPTGIILNRPSLMSIKETRSSVLDVAGTFSDRALYFGGPLDEGLFLLGPNAGTRSSDVGQSGMFEEVIKGLYYGTKESLGCAAEMVKRSVVAVEDFRFFDGYCGWKEEQLQEEIRAGFWTMAACSPSVIGLNAESRWLWEKVLGLMGPRKVW